MRITTGKFKGRNICMPKGIRPTQGKVRKAIFDILGGIEGLSFLELFAGSGAVGIEAASRGAKQVVFVENNPNVLKVLSSSISRLLPTVYLAAGQLAQYCVLPQSVESALGRFNREKKRFDIIFLDPPYHNPSGFYPGKGASGAPESKKTLQTIEAYDILAPNGLIVAQHFEKDILPVELGVLSLFRQYKYGTTIISLYKKHSLAD
ncbi:MAG: 16S rRNA (guanine(966)-N(2))-methyltransferase RsmD [Candidatus Omnitrophota bacterium]